MDPRRWKQITDVFDRCLAVPPAERMAFAERVCGQDAGLLSEVLGLLERDGKATGALEAPYGVVDSAWGLDSGDRRAFPELPGPYRIDSLLGRGGMGTVYLAERSDEYFERLVAVKVLRRGMHSADVVARFQRERQVLADLQHPGIAQLLDGGKTRDGRPFLVMELVEGVSIDRYCEEHELELEERVQLFLEVCAAIQHAHEAGVVHRDVKPSNVLVTRDGHPKLVDFGIAKLVGEAGQTDTLDVTLTEQRLMTPAYASPEQVRGGRVSAATDVYALGILLYELLTGQRAYRFETGTPQEIERVVCEEDPARPSAVALRKTTGKRRLDADLDTICMMALRKEPERRYASVRALAEDLGRWLEGRPVQARPDTLRYRATRFVGRNRLLVGATFAVVLVLLGGLIAEEVRRSQAQAERDKVLRLSAFQRLEDLRRESEELWPPRDAQLEELDDWLARADELVAGLDPRPGDPGHRARLAELEARGRTADDGRREFDTEEERWWHGQLVKLIAEIEAFADPESGPMYGVSYEWGWGVARRRDWARKNRELSLEGDEARALWRAAVRSIASREESPEYGGLSIEPQLDLLPLRKDPESGLWEFAHLPTGRPPELAPENGRWRIEPGTGLVFVLVPGGNFRMGAQAEDATAPNYSADAVVDEGPVHEVELSPFFLSKYELTQGQWVRLMGLNPSFYSPEYQNRPLPLNLVHPVESVNWFEAERALSRLGLTLPSEAQWEYAARAGTTTPWWTGAERESIRELGAANLNDRAAARSDMDWAIVRDWPEFDDGFAATAPVDALAPNPFGLHHVIGNVAEWCRDGFVLEFYARSPARDPVCTEDVRDRVVRGGSFYDTTWLSRSSARTNESPLFRDFNIGFRPARALE